VASFAGGAEEQRAHFRTDWHRLNVRRKAFGRAPLAEAAAEAVLESGAAPSLSASDSDSDGEGGAAAGGARRQRGRRVRFERAAGPHGPAGAVGLWRAVLFSDAAPDPTPDEALAALRALGGSAGRWAVFLCSGGHFAGAVFDMRQILAMPSSSSSSGARGLAKSAPARDSPKSLGGAALGHKTFHRYVVRAKAGGRQAAADGAKTIKSAGSSLRRHNERALVQDIQGLLASWRELLAGCDLVFVHAPGPHNSEGLFSGPAGLDRADPRVRRLPFPARRPTFSEACRVARALAAAQEEEHGERARGGGSAAPLPPPPPVPKSKQGATAGAAGTGGGAASNQGGDAGSGETAEEILAEIWPLHAAARDGDAALVAQLLDAGADPAEQDGEGRTAYMLARERGARDAFRRFRARAGEGAWDWLAAGVPEALTPEMEQAQAARKAEKDAKKKQREKERKKAAREKKQADMERAAKEALERAEKAREPARGGRLGGAPPRAVRGAVGGKKKADSPEARRELMAAAAEKRLAALGGGGAGGSGGAAAGPACDYCAASLAGTTPFERLDFKYCSTDCVREHRKVMP